MSMQSTEALLKHLIHNERFTTSVARTLYLLSEFGERRCGHPVPTEELVQEARCESFHFAIGYVQCAPGSFIAAMKNLHPSKTIATGLLAAILLLAADPALAFRCGTKLVRDGMHEQQVIAACGEPTSVRHLGHTIRAYDYRFRLRNPGHIYYRTPGVGHFATEVIVTEFIYNFGPRKLMRRLIFEGNVLVEIESIGYGYIEK
ncbi:MAG: DUF2845 domain-containing protein [Gammaproteobacteria bacterium]